MKWAKDEKEDGKVGGSTITKLIPIGSWSNGMTEFFGSS